MSPMFFSRWTRIRRALIALGAIALVYGIAAEIGRWFLPHRIWLGVHLLEDVELLPPYRSLIEEATFLFQSGILPSSVAVSAGRVLIGFVLGSVVGMSLGLDGIVLQGKT